MESRCFQRSFRKLFRRAAGPALLAAALVAVCAPVVRHARAAEKAPAGAGATVDFNRQIRPIFTASCVGCHGPEKNKANLRLDAKVPALAGGASGPAILRGKGSDSLLVHRIKGLGHEDRMPLKKPPLPAEQIDLITRWIDQGAAWPDDAPGTVKVTRHWAFEKPARPALPEVKDKAWPRNAVDAFVLARLDGAGIKPSPEAPRETLLRRLSLDLTGLPPSPAEIAAFVADQSPGAYERQVDRLLASPHYGERWGKHWLDAARYADSNGYSIDAPRSIWKYRDWVIDAINRDLPFDRFVIEQLAGDLLPNATIDQKIATGFHRNTQINQEGGIDPEQFRIESVVDRVNTTGSAFLGLTVGCAQCHNHKFDPISQKEYYRLFAYFNNQDEPTLRIDGPGDAERRSAVAAKVRAAEAEVAELSKHKPATDKKAKGKPAKGGKPEDAALKAKRKELAALKKEEDEIGVTTMVLAERPQPRPSHVFIKGDFTRLGEPVTPGGLSALHPMPAPADPKRPSRLDLANWIIAPENPLIARVTVNRIWMRYFGRGLVQTEEDFGTQGTLPTHPELLDWLATEFMSPTEGEFGAGANSPATQPADPRFAAGPKGPPPEISARSTRDAAATPKPWSLKHVHRLIVTSAAYRQSSTVRPDLREIDPDNKLYARQSRVRLDAEVVRDVGLVASGLLARQIGGPGVFPPQPPGVMDVGQTRREWKTSTGADRYRRGMYTFLWRATPHPLLTGFDAPDGTSSCTRRNRSNTPLQALTLLNDEAFVEFARALATRVLTEVTIDDDVARIAQGFRLCTGRAPDAEEQAILARLLATQTDVLARQPNEAKALIGEGKSPAGMEAARFAAWLVVSRTMLNLDETITRE